MIILLTVLLPLLYYGFKITIIIITLFIAIMGSSCFQKNPNPNESPSTAVNRNDRDGAKLLESNITES
jgi:hypothetical protein